MKNRYFQIGLLSLFLLSLGTLNTACSNKDTCYAYGTKDSDIKDPKTSKKHAKAQPLFGKDKKKKKR